MRKQFSNQEILLYAEQLNKTFLKEENNIELPIKANFYLQKNIKIIMEAAQEINDARLKIGAKYGEYNAQEESYFITDSNKLERARQDLYNLLSIDQILDICMISLSDLENMAKPLTVLQMNAIFFMIDDDSNESDIKFIEME